LVDGRLLANIGWLGAEKKEGVRGIETDVQGILERRIAEITFRA
jgi:hypothetical protein